MNKIIQSRFKELSEKCHNLDITDSENIKLIELPLIYPKLNDLFPDLVKRLGQEVRENRFQELQGIMQEGTASSLEEAEYNHLKESDPKLEILPDEIRILYEAIKRTPSDFGEVLRKYIKKPQGDELTPHNVTPLEPKITQKAAGITAAAVVGRNRAFGEKPNENFMLNNLLQTNRGNFMTCYKNICDEFSKSNRLLTVEGMRHSCSDLPWPDGVGVYVIWHKGRKNSDQVIYIGMTGKFKRESDGAAVLDDKKNGFRNRSTRYHPYSFTREGAWKDHFEFAPLHSLSQIKKAPPEDRYAEHVPIKGLSIDCFVLGQESRIAPAFLEALLLQYYIELEGRLPMANNAL